MQLTNTPGKLVLPFANAGAKNTIPTASQIGITAGAASLTDGFPPLTRTPIAAGGVPPSGLDMNGILYALSAALRWDNAGGGYVFDSTFANDSNVGGYPKGARILRSDGLGYWLNTAENNTTDPEAVGGAAAGWVPDLTNGVAAVTMTSSNVTLTALQYGKPIIVLSGTLTANLNLIFPALAGEWTVVNNCTENFTVTCKTATGTGITMATGGRKRILWCDGTNMYNATDSADTPAQFDASTAIATMAAVQRALGNFSGHTAITGSTSLTVSNAGQMIQCSGSGPYTVTLPAASTMQPGTGFFIFATTGPITVTRAGADTFFGIAATSFTLNTGDSIHIEQASASGWLAYGGTASLGYSAVFGASIAANGYQKLPSGLIIQWGVAIIPSGSPGTLAITYPIAFPNGRVCGLISPAGNPSGTVPGITLTSNTVATLYAYSASQVVYWLAIGY